MSRIPDIYEKLEYADYRHGELCNAIMDAGLQGQSVRHISNSAGEVLSASREVFDYIAKEIVETLIAPVNPDIDRLIKSGKARIYFPFYEVMLTKAGSIFSDL